MLTEARRRGVSVKVVIRERVGEGAHTGVGAMSGEPLRSQLDAAIESVKDRGQGE